MEDPGWIAMAVIILLAQTGLFGGGPASSATRSGPSGFEIVYERIDRQNNPSQLQIELPPEAVQGDEVKFWIDRNYLEQVQIEDISPTPDRVEVSAEQIIYTVKVADPGQPVMIKLDLRQERSGLVQGRTGWPGGDALSFSQFVFP